MREFLLRVVESLQRQWREHVPKVRERFPYQAAPCHTCAINPSTNEWQGMENTALHFANALARTYPFYCHDGAPFDPERGWAVDLNTAPLCSAFTVLMAADTEHDDPGRCVRLAIAEALGNAALLDSEPVRRMADEIPKLLDTRETEGYEAPPGASFERMVSLVVEARGIRRDPETASVFANWP